MQGEETGERFAGDDRTPQQQVDEPAADERHAAHDRGADSQTPVSVLVETQDLTGESHAKRHQQQENSHDPGEFPRILVGSKQEHLNHMDEHQRHHEVGAPTVHGTQEPSECEIVVKRLKAVPGLGGRGHINDSQQNAGDDLQDEYRQGRAAENVPPAGARPRHAMERRLADGATELQASIHPFTEGFYPAHGFLRAAAVPESAARVGNSPARMTS